MTTRRTRGPRTSEAPITETRAFARKMVAQLEEKSDQLALVNGMLRTAIGAASLAEVLRVFASNLKSICPFDRLSVSIYDAGRNLFRVPYAYLGGQVIEVKEGPWGWADTPLARAVETRQPFFRKSINQAAAPGADREFVRLGLGCAAIFPLLVGDRAFGTFQLGCFEAGRLTERHVALLQEFLPAIAIVVQRFTGRGETAPA
jgi:GAF domain-containing protein